MRVKKRFGKIGGPDKSKANKQNKHTSQNQMNNNELYFLLFFWGGFTRGPTSARKLRARGVPVVVSVCAVPGMPGTRPRCVVRGRVRDHRGGERECCRCGKPEEVGLAGNGLGRARAKPVSLPLGWLGFW